jgi:O-acetyl-ADP-ribose deacetylase (regulator of RNase III)
MEATVECVQGDIASQHDLGAVVNAANAQLLPGSGVAGAIHSAAGPGLVEECRSLAPIRPGEAVMTGGHNLPNRYVIHCLGPVYGVDEPADELLADCYRNALRLADQQGLESVGFPAISTGVFGYPAREAARVALQTVRDTLPGLESVRRVRFVLFSEEDLALFQSLCEA